MGEVGHLALSGTQPTLSSDCVARKQSPERLTPKCFVGAATAPIEAVGRCNAKLTARFELLNTRVLHITSQMTALLNLVSTYVHHEPSAKAAFFRRISVNRVVPRSIAYRAGVLITIGWN